ncbi:MBOAT family protein [Clostridium tagluense]|uniref:MBOAT family O-acyltransferase n=1 Tax=Clostridium tagluense TaxID=360422 RepID=UPI001C0E0A9A|nr:MBOAT family O-acyltransferase [Clostridium tagluense]MBU3129381.1 MBOAT family protein [Clostridium tagluense]MCB2310716.1 MBOAT family protein [Clostridium tagluense]MCB2315554.1 MBOAT family protein [Clostridium tagluense]MCB2320408.1 MBOAT family protein [Clostridium tagluense]MCB2325309.1 MBOAT family protein [Clostridium tagluense]
MVFSSLIFIFIFLPLTLTVYYFSPKKIRNFSLLVVSLIFYGWGEPVYISLMVFSIIFDYISTLLISKYRKRKKLSRLIFINTLVVNLGILAFFKYFSFLVDNMNALFGLDIFIQKLPLPVGISFYTFQIISYVVDVYLNKVKVQKNIIDFGAYVTMFPQLVAGPIVQYSDIFIQLKNRKENINQFSEGIERFILGLGKKVLIANNIGMVWTVIKSMEVSSVSVISSWLGIVAFTLQIYFDFSGYSDMAIGLGKMFGFEFIENFNYPYISRSVTEFWRRWHISLGSWFREYLYIPLGGNRVPLIKQLRNLFIVWFATGLWHGASWNFIFWGLYFGFFIFSEKILLGKLLEKLPRCISNLYTMIIVIVGWVFFDMNKLSDALSYIKVMFGLSGNAFSDNTAIYYFYTNFIIFGIAVLCATPVMYNFDKKIKSRFNARGAIVMAFNRIFILFLSTAYLVNQSFNPFLYFRF